VVGATWSERLEQAEDVVVGGQATRALERLGTDFTQPSKWLTWIWLHWHVALRAEAAVLAHHQQARTLTLAGGDNAAAGNAALTDLALTPDHGNTTST
jgi:hypothetical protein